MMTAFQNDPVILSYSLPLYHHSADQMFLLFWVIGLILRQYENGVDSAAQYITAKEQTQLNQSGYFLFIGQYVPYFQRIFHPEFVSIRL